MEALRHIYFIKRVVTKTDVTVTVDIKTKVNTKGLVIRQTNVGDYDRAVSILTHKQGIISAFANGARRLKSRKMSSTGLLSYAEFSLSKNKDTYKIDEAEPITIFYGLRSDIEALSLAEYFCELCQTFIEEDYTTDDYLPLILNSLAFLENKKRPSRLIKAVTELRLLCAAGYMPDLSGCECQNSMHHKFDIQNGILCCNECVDENTTKVITLNNSVVAAMRFITSCPFEKIYNFTLPDNDLELLVYACEQYVIERAEKNLRTLQFYNSIRI